MVFAVNDPQGRIQYEGDWAKGKIQGLGKMVFEVINLINLNLKPTIPNLTLHYIITSVVDFF